MSNLPKVLLSKEQIKERVLAMAQEIERDFKGKEITAICILKGSIIFYSDLVRELNLPVRFEFLGLSSYGAQTASSGEVKVTMDMHSPLEGKNVLIIEDIVDSGLTLQYLIKTMGLRKPTMLKCACLLFKPDSLKAKLEIDYVGFKIPNHFVVGYGLDYAEKYRNLPYVGILESE